jgi:hypothetical protein
MPENQKIEEVYMDNPKIANDFANREKGNTLHNNSKKSDSLSLFLSPSLKLASAAALLVYIGFFIYALFFRDTLGFVNFFNHPVKIGLFMLTDLISSLEMAAIAFALFYPIPTLLGLFGLLKGNRKAEAKTALLKHRYFYLHFCIAVWISLLVILVISPAITTIVNNLTSGGYQPLTDYFTILWVSWFLYEAAITFYNWKLRAKSTG